MERAIFLTVLHRLFLSGSDRSCNKWRRDYVIEGVDDLSLHHLYRAMAFIGEGLEDQKDTTPFSPLCIKGFIGEEIFFERRDLFTGLELVFFDTTSIYFEGEGGESLGQKGHTGDHRPDLNRYFFQTVKDQIAVMSCCEKPKHSRTGNEALLWLAALENKNAEIGFMNLKITERPQKVWCPKNLERFPP